jgi:hypothetical protein
MWNLLSCYISGRHEYGIWCEPGQIFLRCQHCGKRSSGWSLEAKPAAITAPVANVVASRTPAPNRVVPFSRAAAR